MKAKSRTEKSRKLPYSLAVKESCSGGKSRDAQQRCLGCQVISTFFLLPPLEVNRKRKCWENAEFLPGRQLLRPRRQSPACLR